MLASFVPKGYLFGMAAFAAFLHARDGIRRLSAAPLQRRVCSNRLSIWSTGHDKARQRQA
jgi:hypothetical protein